MKLEKTLKNLQKFYFKGYNRPKIHFYKCPLTGKYNFDINEYFVVKKPQQYRGYATTFIGGIDVVTTLSNHLSVEINREILNSTYTYVNTTTITNTVNSATTLNFDYASL
jgi:hypothetical protein